MKTLVIALVAFSAMGLASCEKCYKCETLLGTETDCCGDKSDCERFRDDCTLNGGRIK